MRHHEREACRLHAKSRGFRAKVARSLSHVRRMIDAARKPYVAFSGGKDSTVCLALARSIAPGIPALFYHEQWLLPETDLFVRGIENCIMLASPHTHPGGVKHWAQGRPNDASIAWDARELSKPVETWTGERGYDGAVIGLRCDESGYRTRHIRVKGVLFERKNGVHQCYPIASWSDMDVWAYLLSTGTPYNPAYDRMSALGIPMKERRVGPWWNDRAMSGGSIEKLRIGWPDVFTRFKHESQQ